MKPRLARPLIAAVVGGALLAGGAVATSPAFADTTGSTVTSDVTPEPSDSASTPSDESSSPVADPTDSSEPPVVVDPGASSEPPVVDPGASSEAPDPSTSSDAPDPGTSSEPPATPNEAPKGAFGVNLTSLWIGQFVTFSQTSVSDDSDSAAALTRVVDFGDGTKVTLTAGQNSLNHQYLKAGSFKVSETLTDTAGATTTLAAKTVAVTVPGRVTLNTHTVWPGGKYTFKIDRVPAGTISIRVNWGDGWMTTQSAKNQTITGYFYKYKGTNTIVTGRRPLSIQYKNKYGYTSWISAGTINVLKDSWTPAVKITKPSSSNRVKSWSTVRGTVTDKGSGAPYAYIYVTRVSGSKVSCFTAKKKWVRVYNDSQFYSKCTAVSVKVTKGKWSLKVPGQAKGDLYIDAYALDWADHLGYKGLHVKLTRS